MTGFVSLSSPLELKDLRGCSIHRDHHVRGLNDGVNLAADFDLQFVGRFFSDDRNDLLTPGKLDDDF